MNSPSPGIYSYDVRADLRHLGIESQVRFTPGMKVQRGGGVPLSQLAAYYRAADIHLLASSGEGLRSTYAAGGGGGRGSHGGRLQRQP